MSPLAETLVKAAADLIQKNGEGFIAAFAAHDWKTVAITVVEAELSLAAAAGVPFAGVAAKLVPLFVTGAIYAAQHPASADDPTMKRADGHGGGDFGTDHVSV